MDIRELSFRAMSNMPYISYMADMDTYDIIYINDIGKKHFKIKDDSYLKKKCYEVLQESSEICEFCTNKKLSEKSVYKWEHYNSIFKQHFELIDTMFKINERNIRFEIAINVDMRVNKLNDLETKLTLEETLSRCAKALAEHSDMEMAINSLLKIIGEFHKANRAYIFEICEDNIHLNNTYEWVGEGVEPQIDHLQNIPKEVVKDWFVRFEESGEFYITSLEDDVHFDSEAYKILEPQGIICLLAAPLIINKKIIGFIGLDNPIEKFGDCTLLRSVALFIANDLDKKKILDELKALSYLDSFTGIFNRNKFMCTIEEISKSKSNAVGIIYTDINNLKEVNDKFGHKAGDRLILLVVEIIKTIFDKNVYRIGGDEFVVLFIGSDQEEFEKKVQEFRTLKEANKEVSVSIGVSWCSNTERISEEIAYTDKLMYEDKKKHYDRRKTDRKNYKTAIDSDR